MEMTGGIFPLPLVSIKFELHDPHDSRGGYVILNLRSSFRRESHHVVSVRNCANVNVLSTLSLIASQETPYLKHFLFPPVEKNGFPLEALSSL